MQPDFDISLDFDELDTMLDEERKHLEGGEKLKVVQFTDPLCGWCYGLEPVMTKLRFLLPDRLEFSYTLGLMIPDASALFGTGSDASLRFDAMRQQLVYGYVAIARTTGMPMGIGRVDQIKPDDITSLESSLGYEAVKIAEGPERAISFMRALRQAVYAFETPIGSREDVAMLANLFGVDMKAYDAAIESGEAKKLLDDEVRQCAALKVEAFPTLLLVYGGRSVIIRGYQPTDTIAHAIAHITDGAIELTPPEYSQHRALELLDQFGRVAAEELRTVFSLTPETLIKVVQDLHAQGLVDIIPCGNSVFISKA